jgi:hypothetical protein
MRLTQWLLQIQTIVWIALSSFSIHGFGQDALWSPPVPGFPGSADWNAPGNWTPSAVPTGTATFDVANNTQIGVSGTAVVAALQFTATAPAYTFTLADSSVIFELDGSGIANASETTSPTFNTGASSLVFASTSTAANAIINTNDGGNTHLRTLEEKAVLHAGFEVVDVQ